VTPLTVASGLRTWGGLKMIKRFDFRVSRGRRELLGIAFLFVYVAPALLVRDPEVRALFIGLLLFHAVALLLARLRDRYARLNHQAVEVRLLLAPLIRLRYCDIECVDELPERLDPLGRVLATLAFIHPALEALNSPAVKLTLRRRKWILFVAPVPVVVPTKTLRLPVSSPGELVRDVRGRISQAE